MKRKILLIIPIIMISTILFSLKLETNSKLLTLQKNSDETISSNAMTIEWQTDGKDICTAINTQYYQKICSDGTGGAIITWEDKRNAGIEDIYAQRINSSGDVIWRANGTPICNETNWQHNPEICSDEEGGAIITWADNRRSDTDIYVQRINSTGYTLWTANGTPVCTENGAQSFPQIVKDGFGGAIISWQDLRGSDWNIYAQRINSTGHILWTANGTLICNALDYQYYTKICGDCSGGAIIVWRDRRPGINHDDIYAQRVDSNGTNCWIANGTPICTENAEQWEAVICSDGVGGAIMAWEDLRSTVRRDIYAQRVDSNGNPLWGNNGSLVSNKGNSKYYPDICQDGYGGAIIAWEDNRTTNRDIYAQRINSSGQPQWLINGTPICTANGDQWAPKVCSDGIGGAKITWWDQRSDADIYIQWVHSSGTCLWTTNGVPICSASGNQWTPEVCCDTKGGSIVTWYDWRGSDYDIYAQRVTDVPFPNSNHPADINTTLLDSETIGWKLYGIVGNGKYRIWVNDSNNNYYIWQDWSDWSNNTDLQVPINRTMVGFFNYTIEYNNSWGQFGISDTVIVKISSSTNNWDLLLIIAAALQQPGFFDKFVNSVVKFFSEPVILEGIALVEFVLLIAVTVAYKKK